MLAPSSAQESNSAHEINVSGKGSYYNTYKEPEYQNQNTLSLAVPKKSVPGGMMKSLSSPTRNSSKGSERSGRSQNQKDDTDSNNDKIEDVDDQKSSA